MFPDESRRRKQENSASVHIVSNQVPAASHRQMGQHERQQVEGAQINIDDHFAWLLAACL